MSEVISIDVDLVSTHSRRVLQVASDVALAADAAGSADIGGGAFGVVCGFLVPPLGVAAAAAQRAIRAAEAMLERSAVEFRGVSSDIASFEDEAERTISTLDAHLG